MSLSTRKARLQTLAPIFATTLASLVVGGFWAEGEYESQRESAQVSLGALARSLAPDVERLDIGAALTERLEDHVTQVGRDSRAVVLHSEDGFAAVLPQT